MRPRTRQPPSSRAHSATGRRMCLPPPPAAPHCLPSAPTRLASPQAKSSAKTAIRAIGAACREAWVRGSMLDALNIHANGSCRPLAGPRGLSQGVGVSNPNPRMLRCQSAPPFFKNRILAAATARAKTKSILHNKQRALWRPSAIEMGRTRLSSLPPQWIGHGKALAPGAALERKVIPRGQRRGQRPLPLRPGRLLRRPQGRPLGGLWDQGVVRHAHCPPPYAPPASLRCLRSP